MGCWSSRLTQSPISLDRYQIKDLNNNIFYAVPSKFSQEEIERTYTTPISADLENMTIIEPDNFTNCTLHEIALVLPYKQRTITADETRTRNSSVINRVL